ncbi:type II secretion system protein [Cellulomonas sp. JZ18]|uniref:type II secretion system protein n=1 Tax=Cellulomonas sp. JZ18 TaxID=2654191 RepID=UPI0018B00470|nr:type II secretion system protein [Cellulomonas sp. JZ18]
MRTWWHRLQRVRAGDEGIGLAEVLVAMLLFAVVSTGLAYSMLGVLHLSRDSRVRAIAANLAAEEIDLARDTPDIFGLLDETRDVTVGSDTFRVQRRTQWVSDPDTDFTCGSAGVGSALRYKRVNVTVTWNGMKAGAEPVRSDTVLNPENHINDPSKGTILVSVLRADGTGNEGVTVSASPSVGSVIDTTDAQGCTYVLRVNPGKYTVTVSRSGHVSQDQVAAPSQEAVVTANATASLGFQLDREATYTARLAPHAPGAVAMPTGGSLKVTFLSTYGRATPTASSGGDSWQRSYRLHPFTAGYQAYAGQCEAADPTAWPESVVGGQTLRGALPESVAAAPGGTATLDVPMGVVEISGAGGDRFLRAVPVDPPAGSGLPGCTTKVDLGYGQAIPSSPASRVAVALPYGTWRLYYGNAAANAKTPLPLSRVTVPTPNVPGTVTAVESGGVVVTVDPRQPVTP